MGWFPLLRGDYETFRAAFRRDPNIQLPPELLDFDLTLLHVACGAGRDEGSWAGGIGLKGVLTPSHVECVKIILASPRHREDVHHVAACGWTPLHYAATFGSLEIIELLLAHGADPHVFNDGNRSALDLAIKYKHPDVIDRLRQLGVPRSALLTKIASAIGFAHW